MRGLTEKQFNRVIKALAKKESVEAICTSVGIKPSTVKAVRQAKTFEEYERRRKANTRRASANRALNPASAPQSDTEIGGAPLKAVRTAEPKRPLGQNADANEVRRLRIDRDEAIKHWKQAVKESDGLSEVLQATEESLDTQTELLSVVGESFLGRYVLARARKTLMYRSVE